MTKKMLKPWIVVYTYGGYLLRKNCYAPQNADISKNKPVNYIFCTEVIGMIKLLTSTLFNLVIIKATEKIVDIFVY